MEKVYGPKAAKWDDRNGAWVEFPTGKAYLLPLISRETKLAPEFDEDGDVILDVQHTDDELASLVDRFLATLAGSGKHPLSGEVVPKVNGRGHVVMTPTSYSEFVKLMKVLLTRNYSFSNGELGAILTFTRPQLGQLIDAVVRHLTRE